MAYKDDPNLQNMLGQLQNYTQKDNKGDFYEMLGNLLSQTIQTGAADTDLYRQNTQRAIGKGYNQANTRMKEDLSSRGMGGSGAALAAMAQLGGERASAMGDAEVGLSQMNQNVKMDALTKLLGLNSFGAGQEQSQFSNLFGLLTSQQNQFNINRDYQFQKDNQPSEFASLLGSLLGGGAQVATTGFMTNWGKGN